MQAHIQVTHVNNTRIDRGNHRFNGSYVYIDILTYKLHMQKHNHDLMVQPQSPTYNTTTGFAGSTVANVFACSFSTVTCVFAFARACCFCAGKCAIIKEAREARKCERNSGAPQLDLSSRENE
jgi:hypothetical protein